MYLKDTVSWLNLYHASDKPTTINNVKDMLAGLPQYQKGKEAYSLHLGMVQEAMKIFQDRRLADIASVEQVRPCIWQ